MNDKLVKINEKILSKINAYSITKANMPVRAELADIHSMIKEAIISHNNGWISVKDELPVDMGFVLLLEADGDIIIGQYYFEQSPFLADTEYYQSINYQWLADLDEITHWQPLPQPPKE